MYFLFCHLRNIVPEHLHRKQRKTHHLRKGKNLIGPKELLLPENITNQTYSFN